MAGMPNFMLPTDLINVDKLRAILTVERQHNYQFFNCDIQIMV